MALLDNILNIGADAMGAAMGYASIHTAAPDSSGSNESAAARVAVDWAAASAGDLTLGAALAFTGGTASGPATHIGFWSAATDGTFYGAYALTGDQTFNAAGEYSVPSGTISGTAS